MSSELGGLRFCKGGNEKKGGGAIRGKGTKKKGFKAVGTISQN